MKLRHALFTIDSKYKKKKKYQEPESDLDDDVIEAHEESLKAKELEKAEEKGLIEYFKLTTKVTTSNMICFDFDGKIRKYNSPEQIIEDFYPKRLAAYQRRKVCFENSMRST